MAEREIAAQFTSKCHICKMPIEKGAACIYDDRSRKARHLDGGCAREFVVKCEYRATSKLLKVVAFSVEEAIDMAEKECGKKKNRGGISREAMKGVGKDTPERYLVTDGELTWGREAANV